jgi:hypothetical protein
MILGMYTRAPEHISTVPFTNPSHLSVRLYKYSPIFARQRLGKNSTAATNTHATIEELLEASFYILLVSHQATQAIFFNLHSGGWSPN